MGWIIQFKNKYNPNLPTNKSRYQIFLKLTEITYLGTFVYCSEFNFLLYLNELISLTAYTHPLRLFGVSTVHAETDRTLHSNQLPSTETMKPKLVITLSCLLAIQQGPLPEQTTADGTCWLSNFPNTVALQHK